MSEQLKFIVQELNKAPYNMKLNLISFDSLKAEKLLQTLNNVFSQIDAEFKLDVRDEDPAELAVKNIEFLRRLKYKPPDEMDMSEFRQGVVGGSKPVIYHILEWMFQKMADLKKRAYLAKYLTKISIPNDVMGDADVYELYQQYEELIERFKETHKQCEELSSSGFQTRDIRQDLVSMEHERENMNKQVEKLRRKVDTFPNKQVMLNIARNLREEKDREMDLTRQKQEQKNAIGFSEQRLQRLNRQLRDLRQAGMGATPEGLIHKLEEEIKVNSYMVNDKLPKEIGSLEKYLLDLQKVVGEPTLGKSDLNEMNSLIKSVNSEVTQLIEKKMMQNDPIEDKLALFRQQAAIIGRKKETSAERFREARAELQTLETELKEKQQQLSQYDGVEVLRGEEFKRYVTTLRTKSNAYKKKRTELAELRAEYGVLARTDEILKNREESINQSLSVLEDQKGISGFRKTRDELEKVSSRKSELDDQKSQSLDEMSILVKKLHSKIKGKKAKIAPLIKELRELRNRCQEFQMVHTEKKSNYDSCSAGLDSGTSKLENEVKTYRDDCSSKDSRKYYLDITMDVIKLRLQICENQSKLTYNKSDGVQDDKRSFWDDLNRSIQEQESLSKSLREKQRTMRETHQTGMKQLNIWKDLQKIMECKRKYKERSETEYSSNVKRDVTGETLVL